MLNNRFIYFFRDRYRSNLIKVLTIVMLHFGCFSVAIDNIRLESMLGLRLKIKYYRLALEVIEDFL